jgi:hypothetical protein
MNTQLLISICITTVKWWTTCNVSALSKTSRNRISFERQTQKFFVRMTALKEASLWTSINVGGGSYGSTQNKFWNDDGNFQNNRAITNYYIRTKRSRSQVKFFLSFYYMNPKAAFVTGILYISFYIWTLYFIFTSLQFLITLPFQLHTLHSALNHKTHSAEGM